MRLAAEIPKALMKQLTPLFDLDFALAHLVLDDAEYASFYKAQSESGRYVILDNSVHELGKPMMPQELLEAADRINASVIVAPDEFRKQGETLSWFFETLEVVNGKYDVAACVQGVSSAERAEFFMKVSKHTKMLCLPFREARFEWFCDLLEKVPSYIKWPPRIHLLGVNEFWELRAFRDKFEELGIPEKRLSVDTSKPIKFGLAGKRFTGTEDTLRGSGPLKEVEGKVAADRMSDVLYNISFLRRYV